MQNEHIKSIKIKNFEIHEDTEIMLDPGVNIIAGDSRNGKSAIFRAFGWVLDNRPVNIDPHRNNDHKDKPIEVCIKMADGQFVRRIKGKKENIYETNEHIFSVVGRSVPKEVTDIFNLKDYNTQLTQHDPYYLLGETPGARAKKLNDVVGLSIIDAAVKEVNQRLARKVVDIKIIDSKITDTQTKLDDMPNLVILESILKEIRKDVTKLKAIHKKIEMLEEIISRIGITIAKSLILKGKLRAEKEINNLQKLVDEQTTIKQNIKELSTLIENIEQFEELLSKEPKVKKADKELKSLDALIKAKIKIETNIDLIEYTLTSIDNLNSNIIRKESILEKAKTKLSLQLKKYPKCPICQSDINDDIIKSIINDL